MNHLIIAFLYMCLGEEELHIADKCKICFTAIIVKTDFRHSLLQNTHLVGLF